MSLYFKLKKRIIIVIVLSPLLTLRILGRVFLWLYFLWWLISFSYIYHYPLLCAQLLMLFCLIWRCFSQSVSLIIYFGRFKVHCKDWLPILVELIVDMPLYQNDMELQNGELCIGFLEDSNNEWRKSCYVKVFVM